MKNFRVRPFSFLGSYPKGDLCLGSDMLFRSGKTLFSCTKNTMQEQSNQCTPEQPAFELDNWTLQEVRLWASLYIGNGEASSIRLYPLPIHQDFYLSEADLLIQDGSLLRTLLEASHTDQYFMAGNHGLNAKSINDYQCWEWDDRRLTQAREFWECLDLTDAPLMRGLHAILKSEMLFNHFQFRDASISASHIALDAAHSVVLRILKNLGNPSPTSIDAMAYLDDLWEIPRTGLKFFQDYYEDRIRNFHADNRYGAKAIPTFCIDDIWHLNAALKGVFFLLVTGKLHDETRRNRDEYLRYNFIEAP